MNLKHKATRKLVAEIIEFKQWQLLHKIIFDNCDYDLINALLREE